MKQHIDKMYKKLINMNGTIGEIDGTGGKFLLTECTDPDNNSYDLITLITDMNIQQGSLVRVENKIYLVIDYEDRFKKTSFHKCIIRETHKCSYQNENEEVEFNGVIEILRNNIESTTNINTLQDRYRLLCNKNIDINYDSKIMNNGNIYKVVSINETLNGIKEIILEHKTTQNKDEYIIECDDIVCKTTDTTITLTPVFKKNGVVADSKFYYKCENNSICKIDDNGIITILNEGNTNITITNEYTSKDINIIVSQIDIYTIECPDITLDAGAIVPLMYHLYKNGVEVNDNIPIFTSLDNSICMVSDLGDVTGLQEGGTTVTIEWKGITKTVNVTVNAVAINYSINGSATVKHLNSYTYTLFPANTNCTWELDQDSIDLELAEIINQTPSSCTIYTNEVYADEIITLYAKDGNNVLTELNITIRRY